MLRFCAWCLREETENGEPFGEPLPPEAREQATSGICVPCLRQVFPEHAEQVRQREKVA